MDFGTLLHTAKRNEQNEKREIKYYSTKFAPPKKEKRETKNLSANIQKFLARKEEEEKRRADEAKKKREELLALRSQDKKATRRVNVMLKRTKSANQSVIQDAVDKDNTAVTLVGPSQPDEDDYGYVSQEASAFYNKMMEKYSKIPDEPKFPTSTKKVSSNLSSTKDRVKAALEREREEAMMPHKRKRKRAEEGEKVETVEENEKERDEKPEPLPKTKSKPAPPPINFMELLKLAEQKQHEPIVIQPKPKDEDGPLMTKKQKKEYEREKIRIEAKELRMKIDKTGDKIPKQKPENGFKVPKIPESQVSDYKTGKSNLNDSLPSAKIPKMNSILEKKTSKLSSSDDRNKEKNSSGNPQISKGIDKRPDKILGKVPADDLRERQRINDLKEKHKIQDLKSKQKLEELKELQELQELRRKQKELQELERRKLQNLQKIKEKSLQNTTAKIEPSAASKSSSRPTSTNNKLGKSVDIKEKIPINKPSLSSNNKPKEFPPKDVQSKRFPSNDLKTKQLPSSKDSRPKEFPPRDLKPKQIPPSDVKRKPPPLKKRRILDDDDEYDSEMDDFIDDGPEEDEDYSKYIRDIFGYDKNKYKDMDDEDIEEASYQQQWKEEIISTKIGILEDLEDMKKEEEEKRRKALMKKKQKL